MQKVILDVDTGSDDAIAIMLAVLSKKLDIRGITVTWGNRPVDDCVRNTLKVLDLLGSRIPVYGGCPAPMVRYMTEQRNAALKKDGISITEGGKEYSVHPASFPLPDPSRPAEKKHACSYLVETLRESEEKITVITVGPMTNLGMAVRMDPSICEKIERVVIMGGSAGRGNITPCAEANFYHDPEAAKIVLDTGLPCFIVGLEATHSAEISLDDAAELRALGTPAGKFAADLIETRIDALLHMHNGNGYSDAIHDALAVACVLDPEVITKSVRTRCDIDIAGGAGDGMLITDGRMGYEPDETVRTVVALEADKARFFGMLKEAFAS